MNKAITSQRRTKIPWAAAAVVGGSIYNANQQNKTATKAAEQQQAGISVAQVLQQQSSKEASALLNPALQAGQAAGLRADDRMNRLYDLGNRGQNALLTQQKNLNVNQFLDPSMAFQLKEGQAAIQGSLAARGMANSGAALKELTRFGTGLAQQNYNNAANLALQNRSQQVNIGNTLAGMGSDAMNQDINKYNNAYLNTLGKQASIVSGQGENAANLAMSSANVGAASTASQKDLLGTGINSAIGAYFSDSHLKEAVADLTDEDIDAFLNNIASKEYEYTDEGKFKGAEPGRHAGVMAQDLEKSKVGKRMVRETNEGDKMVDIPESVSTLLATAANLGKRIKKLERN